MMTNKLFGKIFYVISIVCAILMVVSFVWFIILDPLPIVVDDAVAITASGGFFLGFITFLIAGSCLCKDGCAKEFVEYVPKGVNEAIKVAVEPRKAIK